MTEIPASEATQPLQDVLTIQWGEARRELFMSFALLHDLSIAVPDLGDINQLAVDAEQRLKVLNLVLVPRDERGRAQTDETTETLGLRLKRLDAMLIIAWVQAHLYDFFLSALEQSVAAARPYGARMANILPNLSGAGSPA